MSLPVDEIQRIARLAHLRLAPEETERLRADLARILDYFALIDGVDVLAVEGTTHVLGLTCPLRDDRIEPSLPTGEALAAAPQPDGDRFGVPRFVG